MGNVERELAEASFDELRWSKDDCPSIRSAKSAVITPSFDPPISLPDYLDILLERVSRISRSHVSLGEAIEPDVPGTDLLPYAGIMGRPPTEVLHNKRSFAHPFLQPIKPSSGPALR
jgi:hypothetical protein